MENLVVSRLVGEALVIVGIIDRTVEAAPTFTYVD